MLRLKKMYKAVSCCFSSPKFIAIFKTLVKALAILSLAGLATQVFAADDLLEGTEKALLGTIKGTGKTYLYIAECLVSLFVYIQTKNVMVLIGIIVVAIFFNIMLTMVGAAT